MSERLPGSIVKVYWWTNPAPYTGMQPQSGSCLLSDLWYPQTPQQVQFERWLRMACSSMKINGSKKLLWIEDPFA